MHSMIDATMGLLIALVVCGGSVAALFAAFVSLAGE